MASANTVMRSGEHCNKLSKKEDIIGFDMEDAGVWNSLPCVIIKAVCDYADSHKNKIWHNYAAVTAASCTKALLRYWPGQCCHACYVETVLSSGQDVWYCCTCLYGPMSMALDVSCAECGHTGIF